MPNKKKLNAGESPAAFYGAQMRRRREAAGWTLDDLGQRVFAGPGYLSQIERAERRPLPELGRCLDREFGTGDFFEDLAQAIRRQSRYAEYFQDTAEHERQASGICEYAATLVPGLLQTSDYARAVIRGTHPLALPDDVERDVSARTERSHLLEQLATPEFWAVLHESIG